MSTGACELKSCMFLWWGVYTPEKRGLREKSILQSVESHACTVGFDCKVGKSEPPEA